MSSARLSTRNNPCKGFLDEKRRTRIFTDLPDHHAIRDGTNYFAPESMRVKGAHPKTLDTLPCPAGGLICCIAKFSR
jgi:hypothetical protein